MEEAQLQTMEEKKPGYKKTKLGWIPEDWEVKKLSQLTSKIEGGGTPSKKVDSYWNGDIPWASVKDLSTFDSKKTKDKITREGLKKSSSKLIPAGTLITSTRMLVGTAVIFKIDVAINQDLKAIFLKPELHPEYLNYFFKRFKRKLNSLGSGSTVKGIRVNDLKNLRIPVPTKFEQESIIKFLHITEKKIQLTRELITKSELRKKGLIKQLLTGKKRLPGFSGKWEEYTYRDLLKEVKRNFDWNDNEEYDLISVRRRSGGLFHRDSLFGHQIKTKNLRTAKAGDFLISKMQILHGASGLTTDKFDGMKISGSYIALVSRDEDTLDINFLNWYSKLPEFYHQCYISSYGVHIEKMTFDFKLFLKEKIKIPEPDEQRAIINVLQASQKEIELLKKKKEMIQTQKKGLMQQLLTGKKRLTN